MLDAWDVPRHITSPNCVPSDRIQREKHNATSLVFLSKMHKLTPVQRQHQQVLPEGQSMKWLALTLQKWQGRERQGETQKPSQTEVD